MYNVNIMYDPLALESKTSINKLEAPSTYLRSSKFMKISKYINLIIIVFVSISINRDTIFIKLIFFYVFMHFELC